MMYSDARSSAVAERCRPRARAGRTSWARASTPPLRLSKLLWVQQPRARAPGPARAGSSAPPTWSSAGFPASGASPIGPTRSSGAMTWWTWPGRRSSSEALGLPAGPASPQVQAPGTRHRRTCRPRPPRDGPVDRRRWSWPAPPTARPRNWPAAPWRPGDWNSTLGTTLVLKGVSAALLRDPLGRLYCHRHPDGYWLPGGASSTGADCLAQRFAAAAPARAQRRGAGAAAPRIW